MIASYRGHLSVVKYLLEERGDDIKERDNEGKFYYLLVSIGIFTD